MLRLPRSRRIKTRLGDPSPEQGEALYKQVQPYPTRERAVLQGCAHSRARDCVEEMLVPFRPQRHLRRNTIPPPAPVSRRRRATRRSRRGSEVGPSFSEKNRAPLTLLHLDTSPSIFSHPYATAP